MPAALYRVTHLLADLGWVYLDLGLSCLGSTAAAVQPNGLWNIPNRSQPNPGLRGDGSPCTLSTEVGLTSPTLLERTVLITFTFRQIRAALSSGKAWEGKAICRRKTGDTVRLDTKIIPSVNWGGGRVGDSGGKGERWGGKTGVEGKVGQCFFFASKPHLQGDSSALRSGLG